MAIHLLQVCNVGNICGGTAACAWSITQALPGWRHSIACFSTPTFETRQAFSGCGLLTFDRLTQASIRSLDPDIVLLHNTSSRQMERCDGPLTIQYLHSRITPASAEITVACSRWLLDQYPDGSVANVLYQPVVNRGPILRPEQRSLRSRLVVGRLCTPVLRKWPEQMRFFYRELAREFPEVDWEFVGCPQGLVESLRDACCGRARFYPASQFAREHLHRWDALLYHHPGLTESFGRVVAEAMLAGCIPIGDDRGGFREQITSSTGFLCQSPSDFAAAIEQLGDKHQRALRSSAARQHAQQTFSTEAFVPRFRQLLLKMLPAPTGGRPKTTV